MAADIRSEQQRQGRLHKNEEEAWANQKVSLEQANANLERRVGEMAEALESTHLALVQLQGAHQENQVSGVRV